MPSEQETVSSTTEPAKTAEFRSWLHRHQLRLTVASLTIAFFGVLMWDLIAVPIRSGEQGVYWSRFFGGTKDWILSEGTAFKLPWDTVYVYDIRQKEMSDDSYFLSKDGLLVNVIWSTRYYPESKRLPELHQKFGPDYARIAVYPEIRDAIRSVIGKFRADQIYSRTEGSVSALIRERVDFLAQGLPFFYDDAMVLRMTLPRDVAKGIENKLIAEQQLFAYKFKLAAEAEEAKRKEIEAKGIRQFEAISGVPIVTWRGIDATVELSKSDNTKIVIMGTDQKSLPLLLNLDSTGKPNVKKPSTIQDSVLPDSKLPKSNANTRSATDQ